MSDESSTLADESPAPSAPMAIGVAWLVHHIAVVGVAGLLTGLLVAGGGGRLLMRIAAIAGHDDATGHLTDSGFRVGETTLGGTLELVLFIGLFAGGIGAILYRLSPGRHRPGDPAAPAPDPPSPRARGDPAAELVDQVVWFVTGA